MSLSSLNACPFANLKNRLEMRKSRVKTVVNKEEQLSLLKSMSHLYPLAMQSYLSSIDLDLYLDQLHLIDSDSGSLERSYIYYLEQALGYLQRTDQKSYRLYTKNLRAAVATQMKLDKSSKIFELFSPLTTKLVKAHFELEMNQSEIGFDFFSESFFKNETELNIKTLKNEILKLYPKNRHQTLYTTKRKVNYLSFLNFDSSMHSLRSKIGKVKYNQKEANILRMGCPVVGKNSQPQIDPLFKYYLLELKKEGKKHLYINNQDTLSKKDIYEKQASLALKALSKDPEFNQTFYLVNLPLNTHLYQQVSQDLILAKTFKGNFNSKILNDPSFYIPSSLLQDSQVDKILDKVHCAFFNQKEYLDQVERKVFIELVYSALIHDCLTNHSFDSLNWTCKHGIDRAMGSLAIFTGYCQPSIDMQKALYIAYWPAVTYYKRAPESNRLTRTFLTLEKLKDEELVENEMTEMHVELF